MKRIFVFIMVFCLCFGLCSCNSGGSDDNYSEDVNSVVMLDGSESDVTAEDICNFKSKYIGRHISVTARVEKVDGPYYYVDTKPYFDYYDFELSDGWKIRVSDEDDIIHLIDIGSKIKASGYIKDAFIDVLICGKENGNWNAEFTEASLAN